MPCSFYRFIRRDEEAIRENMNRALRNAGLLIATLLAVFGLAFAVVALLP